MRQYNLNDNYFDKIDTEEKAYILGFLYADGCHYENTHRIKIDLQRNDEEILYKIKNAIDYKGDILRYYDKYKTFKVDGEDKEYECQPTSRLSFSSNHMSKQLKSKGLMANKSKIIKFPKESVVSKKLQVHFIRGYFDGNGTISYWIPNENTCWKKFNFGVCGTTEIINSISEILIHNFNCSPDIRARFKDRDNNNVQLALCGNRQIQSIMEWLYNGSTIYMQRKYDKYQILLQENIRIDNKGIEDLPSSCFPVRAVRDLRTNISYETVTKTSKELHMSTGAVCWQCKHAKNKYLMYEDEFQNLSKDEHIKLLNKFKEVV